MAGALLGAPARVALLLQFWQPTMEREATPDSRPVASDERRTFIRRECRRARCACLVHGEVGLKKDIAHGLGPGFLIELDQALEFAQDMGVADGVIDRVE